jgi:ABC-type multidrug transport system fused ATPase/permease subunit
MNEPIHQDELNRILLKPRFKLRYSDPKEEIIEQFRINLSEDNCRFPSKIVDHHIVIDVPDGEEHFWSPQLHVEVEKEDDVTIVKGILGPKPKIWTLFIFFHFAVAVTFFVFFVIFYSRWSLDQDYTLSMIMCILMPVLWVVLYFAGQLGKKFGYEQMQELHAVLIEALKEKNPVLD